MIIPVLDWDDQDLLAHFPQCFKFIEEGLSSGGKVLVHWYVRLLRKQSKLSDSGAGISRSPTVVIGYLMHSLQISYMEARKKVEDVRPGIWPNDGFVEQLEKFDRQLKEVLDKQKNNSSEL